MWSLAARTAALAEGWVGTMPAVQVFVTVFSRPQLGAVLGKIEKDADEKWDRTISQGGKPNR